MSFNFVRKVLTGEKEVEKIINLASQGGYGVIELVWSMFRKSNTKIIGFEIPIDDSSRERSNPNSLEIDLTTSIKTVVGIVNFYVDDGGRCWGYVIDTPYNRDQIAKSIKTGWYKIVDAKIREDIYKLAEQKGYETTIAKKQIYGTKVSHTEKALKQELEDTQKLLRDMQKKQEELQRRLDVANGDRKPLEGVKIDRAKMETK
jgi:hypothetical protein